MNIKNNGVIKNIVSYFSTRNQSLKGDFEAPWYAIPIVIGSWGVIGFVYSHLLISPYPSIQPSLLWKLYSEPKVGDYVLFPHEHELIVNEKNELWIKHLSCISGQNLVRVQDSHFTCDGDYIAPVRLLSADNLELPQFYFNGKIPPNKAFVFGDGFNSFDSRHFGLVNYDIMTAYKALF